MLAAALDEEGREVVQRLLHERRRDHGDDEQVRCVQDLVAGLVEAGRAVEEHAVIMLVEIFDELGEALALAKLDQHALKVAQGRIRRQQVESIDDGRAREVVRIDILGEDCLRRILRLFRRLEQPRCRALWIEIPEQSAPSRKHGRCPGQIDREGRFADTALQRVYGNGLRGVPVAHHPS